MRRISSIIYSTLFLLSCSQFLYGQWQTGLVPYTFARTDNTAGVAAGGIGNFPDGTPPLSALHIKTTAPFTTNTFFNAGEVFRTDCPVGSSTFWRLMRGGTSRGRLFNFSTDNVLHVEASSNLPDGGMLLRVS